jgi:hypothetical protein
MTIGEGCHRSRPHGVPSSDVEEPTFNRRRSWP